MICRSFVSVLPVALLATLMPRPIHGADPFINITSKNWPAPPDEATMMHQVALCTADNGRCPEFNVDVEFVFGSGDDAQNITKAEIKLTDDDEWEEIDVDDIPGTTGGGAYTITTTKDCGTCDHFVNPGVKIRITRADGTEATAEVDVILCCTKGTTPNYVPMLPNGPEEWCEEPSDFESVVLYTFALINVSTDAHTYDISADVQAGWTTDPTSLEPITLGPGESGSVEFAVTIPPNTPPGQTTTVSVHAVAQADPSLVADSSVVLGVCAECTWDLDGSGSVGTGDLLNLLANWGVPYGTSDLLALLAAWGACP